MEGPDLILCRDVNVSMLDAVGYLFDWLFQLIWVNSHCIQVIFYAVRLSNQMDFMNLWDYLCLVVRFFTAFLCLVTGLSWPGKFGFVGSHAQDFAFLNWEKEHNSDFNQTTEKVLLVFLFGRPMSLQSEVCTFSHSGQSSQTEVWLICMIIYNG